MHCCLSTDVTGGGVLGTTATPGEQLVTHLPSSSRTDSWYETENLIVVVVYVICILTDAPHWALSANSGRRCCETCAGDFNSRAPATQGLLLPLV